MSAALDPVRALLADADALAAEIGYPDASLRAAYHRQLLMLLAQGYVQVFGTRVQRPDWVPHTGPLFPWGAPNHDTIYGFAPIDAQGLYRVRGTQGTESIASLMFRKGGANTGQVHGATLGEIDVQTLETGDDGRFELLLSARRPPGHAGHWWPIPAETTGLIARHVTERPEQRDGVWSLERLDPAAGPAVDDAAAIEARMVTLTGFVRALNDLLLRLVKRLRDAGHVNALVSDRFQGHGGIAAQMYFQGLFEFAPGEALIIEAPLPERCHYWSVQLVDPFHSAIDFTFHSAAYNGHQSHVGSDGRVRFVIAADDPGVPNWLETAGWYRGGVFWRWHSASSAPQPIVKRVPFAELHRHLPADTPAVDAAHRAAARAARIAQYQSRRRW